MTKKQRAWAVSRIFFPTILMLILLSADGSRAESVRFAPFVQFKLASGPITGDLGSLATTVTDKQIAMRLTNVSAAGADKAQELRTVVDRSDLSLIQSAVYDVVKGEVTRIMQRKTGTSILDNKKTDIFEYKEIKDGKVTTTEPYVQFKVVDFISVMLIAADAIERKDKKDIELSMLRDRSVTRVVLKIGGEETVGGHRGTAVRVAPPDNPAGGIGYVIARTGDGQYYPARISVDTVQLDGLPQ